MVEISGAETKQTRGERRQAAILSAAAEVFLERGYAGATLDEVIRRSGGSRSTLYEGFGGKEGLFAAIVAKLCDDVVTALPELDDLSASKPPSETLYAFGRAFVAMMLTPFSLALYRIVIGESARSPELGRAVFRAGPEVAAERLSAYLRRQTERRILSASQPDLAARHFLEMIKGDLHFRALLGSGQEPTNAQIDSCVRTAVDIFLCGLVENRPKRRGF